MKRILLVAAGALGTAGMIALAAPASADSQIEKAGDNNVVNTFLYGNCGPKLAHCPAAPKVSHPGVLNQFDFFRQDLKSQSATFGKSIESFTNGITGPPAKPTTP